MDFKKFCEQNYSDERSIFLRAHKLFGSQYQKVTKDFEEYEKTGALPIYIVKYVAYRMGQVP